MPFTFEQSLCRLKRLTSRRMSAPFERSNRSEVYGKENTVSTPPSSVYLLSSR